MYSVPIYKIHLVRESTVKIEQKTLRSSTDTLNLFRTMLEGADREHFLVALLDQKNKVINIIGANEVSTGSLTASVVHPREVFKAAILNNSAAIICCHNHPSGDPTPSREDTDITKRLIEAGKILGISVIDHLIVGDGTDKYFSFADNGIMGG